MHQVRKCQNTFLGQYATYINLGLKFPHRLSVKHNMGPYGQHADNSLKNYVKSESV